MPRRGSSSPTGGGERLEVGAGEARHGVDATDDAVVIETGHWKTECAPANGREGGQVERTERSLARSEVKSREHDHGDWSERARRELMRGLSVRGRAGLRGLARVVQEMDGAEA